MRMLFEYQNSFISIKHCLNIQYILEIPEHQNEDIQADYKQQKWS